MQEREREREREGGGGGERERERAHASVSCTVSICDILKSAGHPLEISGSVTMIEQSGRRGGLCKAVYHSHR